MTTHAVRCAGANPADGSTFDVVCPSIDGTTPVLTVAPDDLVAVIDPQGVIVSVTIYRVTSSGPWDPIDTPPAPGDLVVIVGPDEPFHQIGGVGVIRHDGTIGGSGIATLIAYDQMRFPF